MAAIVRQVYKCHKNFMEDKWQHFYFVCFGTDLVHETEKLFRIFDFAVGSGPEF